MKYHQQVSVDLINMVYTAIAYLALAGAAWLFLRLIQACFWLPGHMKRKNDVQSMLKEKASPRMTTALMNGYVIHDSYVIRRWTATSVTSRSAKPRKQRVK